MTSPGPLFFDTFTDQITSALQAALHRAYDSACEQHDPARGFNEQTFGYSLYHCAAFELGVEADNLGAEVEVEAGRPSFRLRIGEFRLGCHRVGQNAAQDIARCFPGNESGAPALIEKQLWLPGLEPRVDRARNLVLAHLGNTESGLEALYLCIPSREEKDKIAEWGYTHSLWTIDDVIVPRPSRTPLPVTTAIEPEELIAEPTVRRKEREQGA